MLWFFIESNDSSGSRNYNANKFGVKRACLFKDGSSVSVYGQVSNVYVSSSIQEMRDCFLKMGVSHPSTFKAYRFLRKHRVPYDGYSVDRAVLKAISKTNGIERQHAILLFKESR